MTSVNLTRDLRVRGMLDGDQRWISFVASHEALDRDGEVIDVAGIDTTNFMRNPVMLLDHDRRKPFGRVISLRRTEIDGRAALIGEVQVLPAGVDPDVDVRWTMIRNGVARAVSIGFYSRTMKGNRHVSTELLEVSSVVLPSCPTCTITNVKCACEAASMDLDEAREIAGEIMAARSRLSLADAERVASEILAERRVERGLVLDVMRTTLRAEANRLVRELGGAR